MQLGVGRHTSTPSSLTSEPDFRHPELPASPSLRRLAVVAAVSALVSVVFTWPLARHPASTMTAQPFGDPLLNTWILAWGADRLLHGFREFWTGLFFYPYPDTVAYSEHLLGISLFTAPVQWATGNPVLAYNVAIIGSGALAGLGAWLLAREVCGREDVAWVAAAAFACAPYRASQLYHLQVLASGWIPLSLWALTRYFRTGDRRWAAAWAVSFVLNAYSNGYFLFFAIVPTALLAGQALWRQRGRVRRILADLSLASVAVLVVLAPVALAYMRVRRDQGLTRSLGDLLLFSADLVAYGHASARLWFWGRWLPVGKLGRDLFPGGVVLILAAAAIVAARRSDLSGEGEDDRRDSRSFARAQTWLYLAIAVAGVLLSLGPQPVTFGWKWPVAGPYAWLMTVLPGLDGLRVPARMATIVSLALAVLAALGLDRLTRRLPGRTRRSAVTAVAIVVMVEGLPRPIAVERFPTPGMGADRAAYEWLRDQPPGPLLELPVGDEKLAARYLYETLRHRHRIVNGYSGYGSALQSLIGTPFGDAGRLDDALTMARALGIRWLAIHAALYDDSRIGDALIRDVRSASDHVVGVEQFGSTALAELRPLQHRERQGDPAWRELSWRDFVASASHNPSRLTFAFDGDRNSRWFTGERQRGDEWIELRFGETRDIARVRLEMDRRSRSDYPRGLAVTSVDDAGLARTLFAGGVVDRLALSIVNEPKSPGIDVELPPNRSRVLRLSTMGTTRTWYWSIAELRVFER